MKTTFVQKWILPALLALLALLPLCACGASSGGKGLLITEVVSSNKRSLIDEAVGSPDWVELYNGTGSDMDLSGYGLSDNMRDFHKYTFPEGTVIRAGEYMIVYAGDNNGVVATSVPCTGFGLSRSGDYLFLTDPYYNLLAEMQIPALVTDLSYARRGDGSYGYCNVPTPGAANVDADIQDSIDGLFGNQDFSLVVISEVMPSDAAEDGPWVELYNGSDQPMRLDNYYISDSAANLKRFQLPDAVIAPHGYALVHMNGQKTGRYEIETSFKLGKTDTAVYLTSIEGELVSELSWELDIPSGLAVVAGDGGRYTAYATPGAPNSTETFDSFAGGAMDQSDPVRINEVLQKNLYSLVDSDGDRNEWVELYNGSGQPVSLHGYFLSDTPDDLFRFALPDVTMGPGEHLVVFLSGKNRTEGEIHASFGLSADETMLYLTNVQGMRTDTLPLLAEEKPNVSVGRDASGNLRYYAQPTPGAPNANGFETADSIGFFNSKGVYIAEVSAAGAAKSGANDWVELYNGGESPVDLSGWYLSDSLKDTKKWQFPAGTVVAPGGYFVVEATGHESRWKEGVATFGISASGETMVLSDAAGEIVDVFETGVLSAGLSSGRIEGDVNTERVFFTTPTRGRANASSTRAGYAPQPQFSETGLYQSEPLLVKITAASPDATIYYTTNGATPTKSSNLYTGAVNVSKTMVLRAVAYQDGMLPSEVTTATYIFEEQHTLPVVTIAINPDDFHTVSNATKTEKPERAAQISYYEANGQLGVSFPAGLKAKGQGTIGYAQKSFTLSLRGSYGRSSVTYPFFEDCAFTTFSSLVLRNSGQDYGKARIRDALFSRMMKGMNLDYAETRPVAVYINGRYWGLYDFNEDLNSEYLETHYGVDSDTVDFVKRNATQLKGSNKGYLAARKFGQNQDLSDDALFAQFAEMVDVAYCTDYIIAQTFIINSDMFNQKFWHSADNTVKWRPVFYDLDWGLNEDSSTKRSLFAAYFSVEGIPSRDGSLTNLDVFVGLKKNAAWREMFIERYVELLCTQLSSERITALFDGMVAEMEPEMERHIQRWGNPSSVSAWRTHIEKLRKKLQERPAAALENLQSYFRLSDEYLNGLVAKYSQ